MVLQPRGYCTVCERVSYRLEVTGRVKHYISAFGEHVIGEEVERAMQAAKEDLSLSVREFTVAPEVNPSESPITNGLLSLKRRFLLLS